MTKRRSFSQVLERLTNIAKRELFAEMSRQNLLHMSLAKYISVHINLSEKQALYRLQNCNWALQEWADIIKLANSDKLQQATMEEFSLHRNQIV